MKLRGTLVLLCLFVLTVSSQAISQEQPDILAIRAGFAQALDNHDLDEILSYFTEDGVQEFIVLGNTPMDSEEEIRAFYMNQFSGNPDWHTSEGRVLTDGDIVVVDHAALGTNTGPSTLPITGKPWTLPHLDIYEFEGDKIKRLTTYGDYAGILVQLGFAPMPEMPDFTPSITVPDPEPTGLSPMEANMDQIDRWNSHDAALMAKIYDTDTHLFAGPLGAPLDRVALTAMNEMYFSAFPDVALEVVRAIDLGDGWVLTELLSQATHQDAFMGIPAAGYPTEIRAVWLTRYAQGLVIDGAFYYDNLTLMTQMTTAPYPLDGIWITTYPTAAGNLISTTIYTAQDAAKTRYTGTLEFLNSFGASGLYPDADPSLRVYAGGHAVTVGRNKYEAIYLGYDRTLDASTGVMEIAGLHTVDAQFELLDANLLQGHGTASYYMAAQDADQDGFPDEGESPVLSYPFMWTGKRLTPLP
ncbi:MAG: ester cyclase [Phycisphaerae bacterium]|nr:ester cyclase [Phycisphaerae bacterium]